MMAGTLAGQAHGTQLTVEDYCDPVISAPASVKEMRPMADGLTYCAISDDGRSIEVFSYKSGKKLSTIFSLDNIKGDLKIDSFDGYEISSNGKKILLWNAMEKIYRYSFKASYFVYDIERGTLKRVSEGGAQQGAVLSHDGRMVAYQRDNNIFISNLDYGTDLPITDDGKINSVINGTPDWGYEEEFGVINTMRWAPDDSTLAFIRFDESGVPTYGFDNYRGYCSPDPEGDLYPERFSYKYPLAGFPNSIVSAHVYNLDTRVTKTMQLPMQPTDYIPRMEYGGSSDRLMITVLNRDQNEMRLFAANPGSTVCREIYVDKWSAWLSTASYGMTRFGDTSFVIASDRTGYRHLYEYDYSGNLKRTISSGDFNITAYYGSDSKGTHYAQTTALGAINRNVARFDRNGKMTLLHDGEGCESASFSSNFDYYVRNYSSATVPPQYTLWTTKGSKVADLELNKEYAEKYASAPKMEFLKVRNDAGQEMDAYMIKPLDFDSSRHYPLMTYQYNGPESQEVINRWRMEGIFYIASQGYVVGCVDGRGTGNRDRAWSDCVYKDLGHYETLDQIAGARWFASQPFVDADKTACFGWSYGGYMTLMELTAKDSPFKCGVSMAPVTDWRFYDSIYTERYMLTPQQNPAGYEASSALHRAGDLKGRLLIMSGTSDDNVHFYNTLKFTSKLTEEGKVFDMMAYTSFEHSLRMCNARVQLFKKIVDFLDTRLK